MTKETTFEIERLDQGYLIDVNGSEKIAVGNETDLDNRISKLLSNEADVRSSLYFLKNKRVVIKISIEVFK